MAREKLKHFVSKDAFNIDGLGKKVIDKFWELKFISRPDHIFKLDYSKIKNLDGWGLISVENLKNSINFFRVCFVGIIVFKICNIFLGALLIFLRL